MNNQDEKMKTKKQKNRRKTIGNTPRPKPSVVEEFEEKRICNFCCFEWVDSGSDECPECGGHDTFIK